jgi:hypothetical protein
LKRKRGKRGGRGALRGSGRSATLEEPFTGAGAMRRSPVASSAPALRVESKRSEQALAVKQCRSNFIEDGEARCPARGDPHRADRLDSLTRLGGAGEYRNERFLDDTAHAHCVMRARIGTRSARPTARSQRQRCSPKPSTRRS